MAKRGRPRHPDILTPREWEVLALVREGLSNEQIAERLGITERTARFHVSEILSKLGVSTRQEAAAWQPEERRSWWVVLLSRRDIASWLSNAAFGAVAAIVITAAIVAVWALRSSRGTHEQTTSLAANIATPVATFPGVDHLMIALDDDVANIRAVGSNGLVSLIDTSVGTRIGQVKAGYEPEALIRRTKAELLMTQAFGAGARNDRPSLSVYYLGDLTSPLATIELPGRAAFIVWSRSMALSGNEQYLYYPAIDDAETKRRCPSGGDASVCQVWRVGVVDLDTLRVVAQAPLGSNCMPRIQPQEKADALVICQDVQIGQSSASFVRDGVRLFLVTPKGNTTKVASFPARRTADHLSSPIYTGATAGGQRYMLYDDGALFMEGSDSFVADLLPDANDHLGFNTGALLGGNHYLLAFGNSFNGQQNGLLVFDRSNPASAQSFLLPAPVDHVAPLDADHAALLTSGGGSMQEFDLRNAKVVREIVLPQGTNIS